MFIASWNSLLQGIVAVLVSLGWQGCVGPMFPATPTLRGTASKAFIFINAFFPIRSWLTFKGHLFGPLITNSLRQKPWPKVKGVYIAHCFRNWLRSQQLWLKYRHSSKYYISSIKPGTVNGTLGTKRTKRSWPRLRRVHISKSKVGYELAQTAPSPFSKSKVGYELARTAPSNISKSKGGY